MVRFIIVLSLLAFACSTPTEDPVCAHVQIDDDIRQIIDSSEAPVMEEEFTLNLRWFIVSPEPKDYFDQIDLQMEAANRAFEGYLNIERDSIVYHIPEDVFISDMMQDESMESLITEDHNEEGYLSVYVAATNNNLLGFTRLYTSWLEGHVQTAPALDHIWLSVDGLFNKHNYINGEFERDEAGEGAGLTFVHELGHIGSLDHKFDNTIDDLRNYMSYNSYRDEYNDAQKTQVVKFLANYRYHLIH